ncbi:hypothetical protein AALO_G00145120 [Alosa alosa]|uniref:Uncharacterized protein n=1 Tax=Alosa alosa TaxID=278164 RepID=A0AAV6GN33_9TELE|nr:hypothetical protein AALO_G00145120 [Alosa alosa]
MRSHTRSHTTKTQGHPHPASHHLANACLQWVGHIWCVCVCVLMCAGDPNALVSSDLTQATTDAMKDSFYIARPDSVPIPTHSTHTHTHTQSHYRVDDLWMSSPELMGSGLSLSAIMLTWECFIRTGS